MKIKDAREYLHHTEYRGSIHAVMKALLLAADDEGFLWRKQRTLAEEAGCSVRSVRYAITRLVQDGVIEVVNRGRDYTDYRVIPLDQTQFKAAKTATQSGKEFPSKRQGVPPEAAKSSASYKKHTEAHLKTTEPRADGASVTVIEREVTKVAVPGSLPDDPEPEQGGSRRSNSKPKVHGANTHARCLSEFDVAARGMGVRVYTKSIVAAQVKQYRKLGYTYEDIRWMIESFFLREEAAIRNVNDLAAFFRSRTQTLCKLRDDQIASDSRSTTTENNRQGQWDDYAKRARAAREALASHKEN